MDRCRRSGGRLPAGTRAPPAATYRLAAAGRAAETGWHRVPSRVRYESDRVQDRARSFDAVADLYDEMRPRYPDALFDDLLDAARGVPRAPRARDRHRPGRGHPSPGRAGPARSWASSPARPWPRPPAPTWPSSTRVEIRQTTFEDAELDPASFDLIVSASAWHWVDPDVGLDKAARVLRPGGSPGGVVGPRVARRSRAAWPTAGRCTSGGRPELRRAPRRRARPRRRPGRRAHGRRRRSDISRSLAEQPGSARSNAAHPVRASTYDARQFVRLLDTYSTTGCSTPTSAGSLFDELVELIDTPPRRPGRPPLHATLFVARRLAAPA